MINLLSPNISWY